MQQSRNGEVEDGETFQILSPANTARFTCESFLIVDTNSHQNDSFLCLTAWHGEFVKYALSTLHNDGSSTIAKRFVGAWADLSWPTPAR